MPNYEPQDEEVQIASVSANQVTLATPLQYAHKGARNADGKLEFLPHVGNVSRNVVVRSENPQGTRGHMIFMSHAAIDLRYVEVRDMGRTKMGVLDNSEFDANGQLVRFGTNQIGRYAIHFHHDFGPKDTPAGGYQFTLVGNSVDGAPKWGITVHNSHYGLVRDNVVYNTRGAGIVTEDGTESFNVFDHNFALRVGRVGRFCAAQRLRRRGAGSGRRGRRLLVPRTQQLHSQQCRRKRGRVRFRPRRRVAGRRPHSRSSRAPTRAVTPKR